MQSFVVWSDEIEGRIDCFFYSPKNQVLIKSKFPLVTVKDVTNNVIHPPEYKRIYTAYGYQLLRAQNVKPLGIEINSNKVFLDKDYLKGKKLISPEIGDVLVVRSGVNTGDCAVIEKDYVDLILGADNLVCKCNDKINPFFLKTYLSLNIGRKILNLYQTGATNYHITPENLKKIKIPLPPLSIQDQIVDIMRSAYAQKKQMEADAQRLLDSIDGYVLDELGIKLPEVEDKICFVVNSEEVKNNRADVEYYQLFFEHVVSKVAGSKYNLSKLEDVTLLISNGRTPAKEMYDVDNEEDGSVPIIKAASASDRLVDLEKLGYAKADFNGGKKTQKGDVFILSAAHQAKYVGKNVSILAVEPPQDTYFVGELICVRANPEIAMPEYLFGFLSSEVGYILLNREKRGQTSHIYPEDIKDIFVPIPPLEIQNKIADEVKRRISEAEKLKAEASKIIEEGKKKVEEMILGK